MLNSGCFYEIVKIVNELRRLRKYSNMSVQRKITKSLIRKNPKPEHYVHSDFVYSKSNLHISLCDFLSNDQQTHTPTFFLC